MCRRFGRGRWLIRLSVLGGTRQLDRLPGYLGRPVQVVHTDTGGLCGRTR